MNDQQLDRNLKSIGKECFVTYFKYFADSSLSNEYVARRLKTERGYTDQSCQSRTGHARSIIKAGRAKDALIIISQSKSVPMQIREKARALAAGKDHHNPIAPIPIDWQTKPAVVDRLLGDTGRPLLNQLLERISQTAAQRQWPLKEIRVEHYQDPEVDWEYLLLVMDFNCAYEEADVLWGICLKTVVGEMRRNLQEPLKDLFSDMIHYEFEGNP